MRRILSSYVALSARGSAHRDRMPRVARVAVLLATIAGASCAEEPTVDPSWPLDGGSGGQQQLCATCFPDGGAGLATATSPTTATNTGTGAGPVIASSPADAGVTSEQCKTLEAGVCASYPACAPIMGLSYDSVRYCRGEAQRPLACQGREVECGFGQLRVVDPAGQRWLLPNRCVPTGYNPAPTEVHPITWIEDYTVCPSAGLQTRCAQLDAAGCAANEACFAQLGTQLDERLRCKQGAQHFVACVQNTTCNRVMTYARDATGNTWELIGSCLPAGYTALSASSVGTHTNWSSCL